MPRADSGNDPHRCKQPRATFGLPAAVAQPVSRKQMEKIPLALEAREVEWARLRKKSVWDEDSVREWSDVAAEARAKKRKGPNYVIHMGRLFGLCVLKGCEMAVNDKRRKYKYRVVFQGNQVVSQTWEAPVWPPRQWYVLGAPL